MKLSKASKLLRQIPDIVAGVEDWINRSEAKMKEWVDKKVMSEVEKVWFKICLLPLVYWELQCNRTKNGRSNEELVAYYEQRQEQSRMLAVEQMKELELSEQRQETLLELAYQMAGSFQRTSSQVEGRNGYLTFMQHAHKGIPKDRLKALTVVHNFDIKRADGTTPAQRLYQSDFPDLFEFLCEHVTGFKEPRKYKSKVLKTSVLQC